MATEVDICNMALSFLGDRATLTSINPPEGSAQAEHCARFYPMAVKEILSQARWTFASKRAKLAAFSDDVPGANFAHALPGDCLKVQTVYGGNGQVLHEWTVERVGSATGLLTKVAADYIRYTSSDTPAALFPATFTLALAHLLASKIAGAMVTGPTGIEMSQGQLKYYDHYLRQAIVDDAGQTNEAIEVRDKYMGDFIGEGDWYGQL